MKLLLTYTGYAYNGDLVAITDKDILETHKSSMLFCEAGPLMDYTPYNHNTKKLLFELADLRPKTLATMHGSSFFGDCAKSLMELDEVMKEVWGEKLGSRQRADV